MSEQRSLLSTFIFRNLVVVACAGALAACSSSTETSSSPSDSPGGASGAAGSAGIGGSAGTGGGAIQDASTDADASFAGSAGQDASADVGQDASDSSIDASDDVMPPDASNDAPDAPPPCTNNDDCNGAAQGPYCDTSSGACVSCLPSDSTSCSQGSYCDPATNTCSVGCDGDDDCTGSSNASTCDVSSHQCVGCLSDDDCAAGTVCSGNACVPGCTAQHACPNGESCCSGSCVDTDNNVNHCGGCGKSCQFSHATATCSSGKCSLLSCSGTYQDCDQDASNGCEEDVSSGSGCACTPGTSRPCYFGPAGTKDVGVCKGGTQLCDASGTKWGACVGQVTPGVESCYTPLDDDCDGKTNEGGIGCVCAPNAKEACYTGSALTRNVGACQDGTHTCNASGSAWGPCVGEILPASESCATPVDDDCDGKVNEDGFGCVCTPGTSRPCYGGPQGTQNVGVCKSGTQKCNNQGTGYDACQGDVVPSADICSDNLDNDCNGETNDGVRTGVPGCVCYPNAAGSCYTGPSGTAGVGVCKTGFATCNSAGTAWGSCSGETTPSSDVCTDSLDNDCNGVTNDGASSGATGCTCVPGAQIACYSGPSGTKNVGACHAGKRTCKADGTGYGPCIGEIIPDIDRCTNAIDDDCNGVVNDGFSSGAPGCVCAPNSTASCYDGPSGTAGVGVCKAGTRKCNTLGTGWFGCLGQVLPQDENCTNGKDDDCNGHADDGVDKDGDGFTTCGGDCCDEAGSVCSSPAQVNPGAIEVQGDGVDNNCNGQIDENPLSTCSTGQDFTSDVSSTKALKLLHAMDLCQMATNGSWGIVPGSYKITRANGSSSVTSTQVGITDLFGTNSSNVPRFGPNMTVLSSGRARDANDPNGTQDGSYSHYSGSPPSDFIAPHGNQLPKTSSSCPNGSGANDGVALQVKLKVPINAHSFSFQFRFFSQEYWSYTCSSFNDFYITMLDSLWLPGPNETAIPADKNISFDNSGGYISVNTKQFFTTCCQPKTGYPCPAGKTGLAGTGYYDHPVSSSLGKDYGAGATSWLTTTSPVVPGETITLRFIVWDTSDRIYDSLVLLDNFRWSADPASGPVTTQ